MISFVLFFLFSLVGAILSTTLRCRSFRQLVIEGISLVVVAILLVTLSISQNSEVNRDTVRIFNDGRSQIYSSHNFTYDFSWKTTNSQEERNILNVIRWMEINEGYALVTTDEQFHFIDKQSGCHKVFKTFNEIESQYKESFRTMIHWGPYGQFWEDFKNENWKIAALATIFLLYGLRIVVFMFVKARGILHS